MKPRCPICRKELPQAKSPFRPFCSERCQMIDLDNWLAGRYRIASNRMTAPEETQVERDAGSASGTDAE